MMTLTHCDFFPQSLELNLNYPNLEQILASNYISLSALACMDDEDYKHFNLHSILGKQIRERARKKLEQRAAAPAAVLAPPAAAAAAPPRLPATAAAAQRPPPGLATATDVARNAMHTASGSAAVYPVAEKQQQQHTAVTQTQQIAEVDALASSMPRASADITIHMTATGDGASRKREHNLAGNGVAGAGRRKSRKGNPVAAHPQSFADGSGEGESSGDGGAPTFVRHAMERAAGLPLGSSAAAIVRALASAKKPGKGHKICKNPACGKEIASRLNKCKHCDYDFRNGDISPPPGGERGQAQPKELSQSPAAMRAGVVTVAPDAISQQQQQQQTRQLALAQAQALAAAAQRLVTPLSPGQSLNAAMLRERLKKIYDDVGGELYVFEDGAQGERVYAKLTWCEDCKRGGKALKERFELIVPGYFGNMVMLKAFEELMKYNKRKGKLGALKVHAGAGGAKMIINKLVSSPPGAGASMPQAERLVTAASEPGTPPPPPFYATAAAEGTPSVKGVKKQNLLEMLQAKGGEIRIWEEKKVDGVESGERVEATLFFDNVHHRFMVRLDDGKEHKISSFEKHTGQSTRRGDVLALKVHGLEKETTLRTYVTNSFEDVMNAGCGWGEGW